MKWSHDKGVCISEIKTKETRSHKGLSGKAVEVSAGVNWMHVGSDQVSSQAQVFGCGLRHTSLQEMTRVEQADSLLLVVHVGGEKCESDYCIPPASLI